MSDSTESPNCTIIIHQIMESYILDRVARGAVRVWSNIKAAMPDRIVFILFAVLMIQFGTAVLVRSVRLSKANPKDVYLYEFGSMLIFVSAAVSTGFFLLDLVTCATGFNLIDSLAIFVIIVTIFLSMAQTAENYVQVDGHIRKIVYCEPERVKRAFDEDRDSMTWEDYWQFSQRA